MDKTDPKNVDLKQDDAQEIPEADVDADLTAGLLSPEATSSVNIVDSDGFDIDSSLDYKLMMSDGTELGMILTHQFGWLADESPSNGGAVIEFSPQTPPPVAGKVWNNGATAFIRGASYNNGGPFLKQYLYVFNTSGPSVFHIAWTTDILKATKFQAFNVAGNRIALYAIFGGERRLGIRLNKSKNVLEGDASPLRLSLAGQFVKVQTLLPRIFIP